MNKSNLRKFYLERQRNFSPEERIERSRKICGRFFLFFDLKKIRYLHCFVPIEKFGEIDTKFIFEKIWRDFPHVETLAPRVDFKTGKMENVSISRETELVKNRWHIHEPSHDLLVETEKIDLVLVPLLCFDRRGFRVGYGKGFYDKFLSRCRADCLKIGLNYFSPVEEIADVDKFDVKLDFCVTPEKVFQFA
jgi:5-formyltetrahydrofolate cyclo-ligase